jgi:hypothetical protein
VRNAVVGFCHTPQALPDLAALGNEILIGVDHQQCRDLPVVFHCVHDPYSVKTTSLAFALVWRANPHLRQVESKSTRREPRPAEGERESLHAGVEELDREQSVDERLRLPDELEQPMFSDCSVAALVDVESMSGGRWLSVDRHSKAYRLSRPRWPHDKMHVAGVEAIHHLARGGVQDRRLPANRPVTCERPLIKGQP